MIDGPRAFRWGLAAWTAAFLAARAPYLGELYAREVLRDDLLEAVGLGPPPLVFVGGVVIACFAGLAASLRWPRPGAAVTFVAFGVLFALDPHSTKAYGLLALVQWGMLAVLPGAPWAHRLLVAQWASVYLLSVGAKLSEPAWRTGDALFLALNGVSHGQWGLSAWPVPHGFARALGYAAMATELAVGTLVWSPRTRPLAVALCVGFHLGILASMRISPLFAALMWVHLPLVCTLPPRSPLR